MTAALQKQADSKYLEFLDVTSEYCYTVAGLEADPQLLAHANRSLTPARTEHVEELDVEAYCDLIKNGTPRWTAAELLGIDARVVQKRLQFDGSFRELVELAEERAAEYIEEKLWKSAKLGERWAMEMWLKKRHKKRWGDEPTVVKHEGTVTNELSAAPLIEQIVALQGVLNQRLELVDGNVIDVDSEES